MEPIQLWHKLPKENKRAFEAFSIYLTMRDKKKVIERMECSRSNIHYWQKTFRWEERAKAYDAHHDQMRPKTAQSIYHKLDTKQLFDDIFFNEYDIYKDYVKVTKGVLKKVIDDDEMPQKEELKIMELKEKQTATIAQWAMLLQEQSTEEQQEVDMSVLTDEELEIALEIQKKVMVG